MKGFTIINNKDVNSLLVQVCSFILYLCDKTLNLLVLSEASAGRMSRLFFPVTDTSPHFCPAWCQRGELLGP